MIDKATVEKIKDAADIVDVVGDYVHLIRRGANFVGLCPFHNERTPSFSVNRSRNFCYCFSCHKGGSPVNFIMEKEGISYHDALLQLARKYNIRVEEREITDEERRSQSERESMFVANEWIASTLTDNLKNHQDGKDIGLTYLYGRGITAEAIEKFRLGYSLDKGTDIADRATKAGFDPEILYKLGIIGKSQENRIYDRFRGRVIFPIINVSGKVVGFGGRDLKGGPAKYINSPESAIYKKSNELYGMFQAKGEIVRQDKCYLVEGYLDVIGMWQAGLKNVVASSGTALTDGQITLIHRFTNKITLIYDGDAAGIKASLRGIDMLLKHRMEVKVLLLPDGHDPHSFSLEKNSEDFREYINTHETDIIRFQTQVLLDEAGNDPQRRITAVNSVVQSIASIPDPISRIVYIQECAGVFGLPETTIAKATEAARKAIEIRDNHEKEVELRQQRREQIKPLTGQLENTGQSDPNSQINSDSATPTITTGDKLNADNFDSTVENRSLTTIRNISNHRKLKELTIVEQCLKYGLLPHHDIIDDNERKGWVSIAEYIYDELHSDGISLEVPIYSQMVATIIGLRTDLEKSLNIHMIEVEKKISDFKNKKRAEIASSAISMQGILIAEKKLEEEIAKKRDMEIHDFLKQYPARMLASHENDDIRKLATQILSSPHKLSDIFIKDLSEEEVAKNEAIQMESSIYRAILELKYEVLEEDYKEIMSQLKNAVNNKVDSTKIGKLQSSLVDILHLRSVLAKELGERALNPRK